MSTPFLQVKNLKTHFPIYEGSIFPKVKSLVKAVDGVDFHVNQGEIMGLVGESGCGKSTLGRSLLRLVDITEGSVEFEGQDLAKLHGKKLNAFRPKMQMIFQDPYASLDPRMTVFDTLAEPMLVHGLVARSQLSREVSKLMETVGLAARFMKKYPHEFSGGQRQRISIARALALKPKLIVADEPVSALDVSIQSQILNLLLDLRRDLNLTIVFISHDLSVVKYLADRLAVMYLGRFVETGKSLEVFNNPQHPYTKALLSAIPRPDPKREKSSERILLHGDPPSPLNPPKGCSFHPRCPHAEESCKTTEQSLKKVSSGAYIACHKHDRL